jgi:hypothetical protein
MDLARTFLTMATPNAQAHINRIFAELETEGRAGLQRDLGERAIDFEWPQQSIHNQRQYSDGQYFERTIAKYQRHGDDCGGRHAVD